MTQINYPELGWPDSNKPIYAPGAILNHPSGHVYQRKNGNWVLIQMPDGSPPPPKEE